jgi:Holliday junction resolvase-like predicted endonuclease
MAASPDGVAVVKFNNDQLIVASVEVKTRVATERAEEAKQIAAKYQYKLIT